MKTFRFTLFLILSFASTAIFALPTSERGVTTKNAISVEEIPEAPSNEVVSVHSTKELRKAKKLDRKMARFQKRMEKFKKLATSDESKGAAVLSYITLIGFLISLLALHKKGDEFSAFHLRQSLGIFVVAIVAGLLAIIPIIGWIAALVFGLLALVAWIIGLIGAINGSTKPVFLFGNKFQEWFSGIE